MTENYYDLTEAISNEFTITPELQKEMDLIKPYLIYFKINILKARKAKSMSEDIDFKIALNNIDNIVKQAINKEI